MLTIQYRQVSDLIPYVNNARSRLMELDPRYCDVIIKRWQEYTGKQATLESTGETYNSMVKDNGTTTKDT